mgnify:CR=1 FL=1
MASYPEFFDSVSERYQSVGFRHLSLAEQIVYCVWWLEAEVNNGGFHQFFLNSTGDLHEETVAALGAIGAEKTRTLLQRAAHEAFGMTVPTNRDERMAVLESRRRPNGSSL